jgi:hypothetical protein
VTATAETAPEDVPGKEAKNTTVAKETVTKETLSGETAQTQMRTPNHHQDGEKYSNAAGEDHEMERTTVAGEFAVRGRK